MSYELNVGFPLTIYSASAVGEMSFLRSRPVELITDYSNCNMDGLRFKVAFYYVQYEYRK